MEDTNVPLATTPGSGPQPSDSTALRRPPFFHSVFLGPEGLRAAWRILFYLAMAWTVDYVLSFALAPMLSPDLHGKALLLSRLVDYLVQVTAILLPAFVMARIEKREFDVYGLPRHSAFGKFFWVGAVWGIVSITVLLLMMRGAGAFYFGGFALHGIRVLKFAAYWGAFFLLVGCAEEFLFRGYTLYTVTTGMGFWPAAILMSLLFGGVHLRNPGENYVGGLGAALIGFFFCLTLRRTGHLWFSRFPRLVGLGPKLPLFGTRQRRDGHRTSDEIVISRPGVVNRRLSWSGGQRARVRDHCAAVDIVRSGVPPGEIPRASVKG